jgi:hypothetical protein
MTLVDETLTYTPEALSSELQAIQNYDPHSLIAGSLGRAVVFAQHGMGAEFEYNSRGEAPLGNPGNPRDIDTMGIAHEDMLNFSPFYVDTIAFAKRAASIIREGNDWFITSDAHNYSEVLHPDVMEPVIGTTIFDISCQTVRLQTHRHLFELAGRPRIKNEVAKKLLSQINDPSPQLPEILFHPFNRLRQMNITRLAGIQKIYWYMVPATARDQLRPLAQKVRRALGQSE